jgi:hypothetical protein
MLESNMAKRALKKLPASRSNPKSTRPPALSRRDIVKPTPALAGRKLDAVPDRIDIRDWFYQPSLAPLPEVVVNTDGVPAVLNQGREGACTGFALAAVVNFLLYQRHNKTAVSARMLYEMARRYDEWPGEDYEGSSARGAMKGWVRHGVCAQSLWTDDMRGPRHLTDDIAKNAKNQIGGAFYRVSHREVRDMHAALSEVGILYCTLMVHAGWDDPGRSGPRVSYILDKSIRDIELPIIRRVGRAADGHAIALVGYTANGFVIQNSWGETWGNRGFALLPYEDFMLHATDVWVAQLGVPIISDLWETRQLADSTSGLYRASPVIPLADIRPYVVDVSNNGELSNSGDFFTASSDIERMFSKTIPERTASWPKKRVALYLHGGLNAEQQVARRIVAFRDVMLNNEIYPIHIMWESGVSDTLRQLIEDLFKGITDRAGDVADWLRKTRDGLVEAKDRTFELTVAGPGSVFWHKMKENARLSSKHPNNLGAMQIMARCVKSALKSVPQAELKNWELHVVGHSAGSIYCAHAMPHVLNTGVPLKTIQFMAPAMTVDLFKQSMVPLIDKNACPCPHLYVLSDAGERDDDVGPYGKSLLYLVSNAFEGRREVPLLGMQKFIEKVDDSNLEPEVSALLKGNVTVAGQPKSNGIYSESDTHGGFDNDKATMNSVLRFILGADPKQPFEVRDLQF